MGSIMENKADKRIDRILDLVMLLNVDDDSGGNISDAARLAAELTLASVCSALLIEEHETPRPRLKLWTSSSTLPEDAWLAHDDPGNSIAGRVLAKAKPILVADIARSEFVGLRRQRPGLGSSFIAVPVTIGKTAIGVVTFASRAGCPPFSAENLVLARIAAVLFGKTMQVERLQTMLRSRVAQLTLSRQEKTVTASLTAGTVPPAQLAKMLAKSFYKDLSGAGFNPGQIVEAASEILAQISSDVSRYKTRMSRGKGQQKD